MTNFVGSCYKTYLQVSGNRIRVNAKYDELLKSAACCNMAYLTPIQVNALWERSKKEEPSDLFERWMFPQLKELECPPVFISSPTTCHEDAQLYVWTFDDSVYMAFRGTNSIIDSLADIDVRAFHVKDNIYVHEGFYLQFMSIEKELTEYLKAVEKNKFVMTGHSSGSALAQIASAYYGEMFTGSHVKCHTIGSPRTGNKGFVKWFSKNVHEHIRVVNQNDPITMVPQRPIWTHTLHQCIMIDDDNRCYIIQQDVPWYLRLLSMFLNVDYLTPLKDHSCETYMLRLQRLYDENMKP